jgi:hypothetical protein
MFASSISRVRIVAAVALTAVMALSMALFVASPARAVGNSYVNQATDRCLDGSISQGVRLMECNGSEYQEWDLIGTSPNYVVYHKATEKCLDGSISNGVRLNTCNYGAYQIWEYRKGDAGIALLNTATRTCLDGSISEGVRIKTCNNSDYQRWRASIEVFAASS